MRAIEVESLKEGMRLARTIFDDSGRTLLNSGTKLTERYIKRLIDLGIPFIYVEDEIIGPIECEDIIDDRVRLQTIKALKKVVETAKMHEEIDLLPVSGMVNTILDDLKGVPNMLMQLLDIRTSNTYVYNHSVAVCVLSIMAGMSLELDDLKIKLLGMGALLHDIGKSLSEGPEHTIHGFEILRNTKALNVVVAHVAYQHHERYDGEGFPRKLKGEDIHLFGAITGIANLYDNLVSHPDGDKRLYPYQALETVVAESGRGFHPEVVKAFCRNIAPYPVGTAVKLNNGAVGVVVSVPRSFSTRPVIKLISSEVGILMKDFPEIDLLKEKTLFINEILSEKDRRDIAVLK